MKDRRDLYSGKIVRGTKIERRHKGKLEKYCKELLKNPEYFGLEQMRKLKVGVDSLIIPQIVVEKLSKIYRSGLGSAAHRALRKKKGAA